jgi:MSHA biogenesis protein MshP
MKRRSNSTGGALITAIFLIVVLTALGVAVSKLSNITQDTATKANLSAKVYYGAKAGVEWGIQQAIAAGWDCTAAGTPAMSGALSDVAVTVACTRSTHGLGNLVYYITSRATTGTVGGINYAERRMEATVSNIP